MNRRTVVAWDGTPEAHAALDWAVAREEPRGGSVVIVRVVDDALLEAISDDETTEAVTGALQGLQEQVDRLSKTCPELPVGSEIVRGDPLDRLKWFSNPSTVLVLGTHDPSIRQPRFAWTLTAKLIAGAHGPLVIVPTGPATARTGVVVGVDGSEASMAAATFAATEADRLHTHLLLVHAWLEPFPVTAVGDIAADDVPWLETAHQDVLDRAAKIVRSLHPHLTVRTVLEQAPAAAALEMYARNAALLVVGARGYGPVREFLLGSVSTALIRTMPCPIAVTGPHYAASLTDTHAAPALARL